jgi:NAD-dependent dihydropyrimidine dehydrogenase PreA subunit
MIEQGTYHGLPRGEIDWYPRIDRNLCNGCEVCVRFCQHGVYAKESDKVIVAQPYNCPVGCNFCQTKCPSAAIRFPSAGELRQMLKGLREKYSHT